MTITAGKIRQDLYAILDHYDATLEPSQNASGGRVSVSKEPPMPIGAHILDARRETLTDLTYWARFLLDEVRDINGELLQHGPTSVDVESLVPFVARWVDWLLANMPDDAENLAAEAEKHAKALRNIVFPIRRDWVHLGDCPFVVEDWFCSGQVRTAVEGEAACTVCGQTAVVEWWMTVLDVVPTVTAEGLVAFVRTEFGRDVKRATIRQWLKRGWIESCGVDAEGRTLFDKGAVAYALQRRNVA